MRLTELEPRWIHTNLFVFRCPHCRCAWLSCKNAPMTSQQQMDIFEKAFGEDISNVTPSRPDFAWKINDKDFSVMTVTPSIDASPSGCWHGFITNGEIR